MSDKLNEIFDVEPELVAPEDLPALPASNTALIVAADASIVPAETVTPQLDADFELARTNIQNITKDVTEAAKSAILLAQSGDSPRAYEVVANMLTAIVNANKELVNLHKTKRDAAPVASEESSESGGINIEKAVFVGRASDLLRQLRQIQKPK